jgi:DNA-binding response OmpR family regulator
VFGCADDFAPLRVLLVDRRPQRLRLLALELMSAGMEVVRAQLKFGADLAALDAWSDVVFVNVHGADRDALSVIALLSDNRDSVVIAFCENDAAGGVALEHGADDFVVRADTVAGMAARIRSIHRKYRGS